MNLQEAMSVLELSGVDGLTTEALQRAVRKAQKRWHPDTVAFRKNPEETQRYTKNFQSIEAAEATIRSFIAGAYAAGERAKPEADEPAREPADVIRENAADMLRKIAAQWAEMKRRGYRATVERVVVSEGHRVRDLLQADFDDDIAALSVISAYYGGLVFGIGALIAVSANPVAGTLAVTLWVAQLLSCFLGMLPLSRYWLHERAQPAMLWFVNFGLKIFRGVARMSMGGPWWVQALAGLPVLQATIFKHLLIRPLTFLAKAAFGDRMMGVVARDVTYYAGLADWYIEQLLAKSPKEMTEEELIHLSHLYSVVVEFSGAPQGQNSS